MAWTAPRTWVSSEVPSASTMNTHIRDNMNQLDAAWAADGPWTLMYATAANLIGGALSLSSAFGGSAGAYVTPGESSTIAWRSNQYSVGDDTYTSRLDPFLAGGSPATFASMDGGNWGPGGSPVEVTLRTGTTALVAFGARYVSIATLGTNVQLSYEVAVGGVVTTAAAVNWGTADESDPAGTLKSVGRKHYATGLTETVNTFRLMAQTSSSSAVATIGYPWIMVTAL